MNQKKRILLLLEYKENRHLLRESLNQLYTVLMPEDDASKAEFEALLAESFDLCILDGRTLGQFERQIQERRNAEKPVFLPVLLIVTRNKPAIAEQRLWQSIDEIITTPIEQAELRVRLEILLRIRQFSLDLLSANQKLQEMNELKSQFVSMVSHEFRNPLGAVSGFIQVMERQGDKLSPDKKQQYYQRIHDSLQRMTNLVNDVLIIGRVGVGKLKFEPAPLDLEKFCRNLVQEFKFSSQTQHQINFTVAIGNTRKPQAVCMDKNLLHHIFNNLLENAVKYSPEESKINFTLSYEEDKAIFAIKDQGIGIPLEDQAQLFESFYRATNVGQTQGTGLGLSIVKQCIDLHGGEISCTSTVDRGTIFTVTLPLN